MSVNSSLLCSILQEGTENQDGVTTRLYVQLKLLVNGALRAESSLGRGHKVNAVVERASEQGWLRRKRNIEGLDSDHYR